MKKIKYSIFLILLNVFPMESRGDFYLGKKKDGFQPHLGIGWKVSLESDNEWEIADASHSYGRYEGVHNFINDIKFTGVVYPNMEIQFQVESSLHLNMKGEEIYNKKETVDIWNKKEWNHFFVNIKNISYKTWYKENKGSYNFNTYEYKGAIEVGYKSIIVKPYFSIQQIKSPIGIIGAYFYNRIKGKKDPFTVGIDVGMGLDSDIGHGTEGSFSLDIDFGFLEEGEKDFRKSKKKPGYFVGSNFHFYTLKKIKKIESNKTTTNRNELFTIIGIKNYVDIMIDLDILFSRWLVGMTIDTSYSEYIYPEIGVNLKMGVILIEDILTLKVIGKFSLPKVLKKVLEVDIKEEGTTGKQNTMEMEVGKEEKILGNKKEEWFRKSIWDITLNMDYYPIKSSKLEMNLNFKVGVYTNIDLNKEWNLKHSSWIPHIGINFIIKV